jgi:hypothetical protein
MQFALIQFSVMLYPISIQASYYYVGWGTLALLNAGIAQAKNRSGLFWFIISVFFGPLATFLVVVLPKVKD